MPTYITLINYTQQGVENMKDSPKRLAAAKEAMEATGLKFKAFYLTLGRFDAVLVGEAPSDEAVAAFALAQAGHGAVRTETLRAFTEEEYRQIIASLP
jgi:uncharacterized protein with GYD domain